MGSSYSNISSAQSYMRISPYQTMTSTYTPIWTAFHGGSYLSGNGQYYTLDSDGICQVQLRITTATTILSPGEYFLAKILINGSPVTNGTMFLCQASGTYRANSEAFWVFEASAGDTIGTSVSHTVTNVLTSTTALYSNFSFINYEI
jgi:hypothetical protein